MLYRKLTEKQECFRARLTPKPWRCGCTRPPNRFPWDTPEAEQAYRQWQQQYENKSQAYATCRLLECFGEIVSNECIDTIINIHDQYTCSRPGAILA
ncbi:MAG: hypothetical protein JW860_00785 [Sedimentisphaerales bacterium]|nr:hypothetical protein [Sedimentisphaerales bacterium]